jgi:Flp pilus assembly pilin Flp
MFRRFVRDEEGRTPTEYTVMLAVGCFSALVVSSMAGELLSTFTAEFEEIQLALHDVQSRGFIELPDVRDQVAHH